MTKLMQKFRTRKRTRHKDADMTQGVIWKQLLEFSLPMMLGMVFQQFYNTVDTIVVGQFVGKEALAAVAPREASSTCWWGLRTAFPWARRS